ncbi:MAG: hypothetical protein V1798_01390 [Pseudomonadota bacterium]
MIRYLVQPASRRRLLTLLWHDGGIGSVRALARLAEVPYARAQFELKEMEKVDLAARERRGNAWVYRANLNHPRTTVLKDLFFAEGRAEQLAPGEQQILLHVKALGAPLDVEGEPLFGLPLEEVLSRALPLCHKREDLARAFPFLLARHSERLDFRQLERHGRYVGEGKALGFFLDVTAALTGDMRFHKAAGRLHDRRFKKNEPFFRIEPGWHRKARAKAADFQLARNWHFSLTFGMGAFRALFRSKKPRG